MLPISTGQSARTRFMPHVKESASGSKKIQIISSTLEYKIKAFHIPVGGVVHLYICNTDFRFAGGPIVDRYVMYVCLPGAGSRS